MNDFADVGSLVRDTAIRIFRSHGDPQALNSATDESWKARLWGQLEEAGLPLAWAPEDSGGAGVGIAAGFEALHVSGLYACPAPLAETMLAGWSLGEAGLDIPAGPLAVAPCGGPGGFTADASGRISGSARRVAFAPEAENLALLAERAGKWMVALVAASACRIVSSRNIAGDPQGDVTLEGVAPLALAEAPPGLGRDALLLMGAAARARQMAGALQSVLELAVDYANTRVAFRRPIGRFQSIQHNLARLAGEAAAADAVSSSAADAIDRASRFDDGVFLEVASAKVRCGEAAGEGAAIAHQVFGAIGITREHVLHRFTRRLWAWRDDFGGESEWAVKLGTRVAANGADALWPALTAL